MTLPATAAAILSSLIAVLLAGRLFPEQPATRRLFIALLTVGLLVVPAVCVLLELRVIVGLVGVNLPDTIASAGMPLFPWLMAVGVLWTALLCGRLAVARYRLRRLPACTDPELTAIARTLSRTLGLSGEVTVSVWAAGPASTSLCGRQILLPPDSQGWDAPTRKAVLAHELVHLARRDDLWVNLCRVLVSLYWWLPWLRQLTRLLTQAVEESCDDRASALVAGEQAYLGAIYRLARTGAGGTPLNSGLAGVGLVGTGGSLLARFQRFGERRQPQVDSRSVYWATLGSAFALFLIWSLQLTGVAPDGPAMRLVAVTERSTADEDIVLRLALPPAVPLTVLASGNRQPIPAGAGPPR